MVGFFFYKIDVGESVFYFPSNRRVKVAEFIKNSFTCGYNGNIIFLKTNSLVFNSLNYQSSFNFSQRIVLKALISLDIYYIFS